MGTIQKLSSQVIDYAERVSDMADAAQGKHHPAADRHDDSLAAAPGVRSGAVRARKERCVLTPGKGGHGRGEGTGFRTARRPSGHGAPEHKQHVQPERKHYEDSRFDASEFDAQVEFTQDRRESAQKESRAEDNSVRTLTH